MNARRKRRRDLDRWRESRPKMGVDFAAGLDWSAMMMGFRAFGQACVEFAGELRRAERIIAQGIQTFLVEVSYQFIVHPTLQTPAVEMTLLELRTDLGGVPSMPFARFTSEGGFTLN